MAERTPTLSKVMDTASEAIRAAELSYAPSDAERQLKALFYTAQAENPLADLDKITAAMIEQITNDGRIHKWWSKPGFKEWFCNRFDVQARAEYVLDKLLDSFLDIAISDDPKSYSSKVAAAKFLAELRGYTGRAKTPPPAHGLPSDPDELRAYIKSLEAADPKK
jgi:hypothetical protein